MPPDFVYFVTVLLLSYQFGMRFVLTYRLTEEDVQAVLFGVAPVSVMRYELIEEVKIISALEALFRPAWRSEQGGGPGSNDPWEGVLPHPIYD